MTKSLVEPAADSLGGARLFHLVRDRDVTGFSGTGVVAEGVQWADGRVTIRWCVPGLPRTTTDADSVADIAVIHGHDGCTRVMFP
ncbi:hypothetical protein AB0J47_41820 [Nocardia sp. NPDC049737]|uniref:hypothetical protein n=1 Tax=Nocardia sp. NPDC049737 TaxID=3154358 RepID=UPI00341B1012